MRKSARSKNGSRLIIEKLADAAVFSVIYKHFRVINYPRGVILPRNPEELHGHCQKRGSKPQAVKECLAYQLLRAFFVGDADQKVLSFEEYQYCMGQLPLFIPDLNNSLF